MNTPKDKPPFKSSSFDTQNDIEGLEKQTKLSGYEQSANEALKLQLKDNQDTLCSDTWISFQELEASAWQPSSLGEYRQLSLWKSTPTLNSSCDRISQEYPFTQTFETTNQNQESLTLSQWVSPAQVQVTQELEQDCLTQSQHFGEKDLEYCLKLNPSSVLLNNLKELSDEDLELFLPPYIWQDTLGKLKQSRRRSLEQDTKDSDYLSFPTLTSGQTNSKMRPAGQNGRLAHPNSIRVSRPPKCEKWFKDKGLIRSGSQLSAGAIASLMNFPTDWFSPLSPVKPQEESEPDILQDEQLLQDKQRCLRLASQSHSPESSISIPCLVKQPNQPEVKGVIQKDLGDCEASRRHRFLVDVSDELITVSKLFVYPDFSETVPQGYNIGQIEKNPSKISTPSKTRRRKGEGNGSIHWRTVTRNGKEYRQAYYHWVEDGKKRTKYIPKKLLDRLKDAEFRKLPIADILILLGGKKINPSKSSDRFVDKYSDNSESDLEISPSKIIHPSKKRPKGLASRRKKGYGTGYIECKPIKRSGKEYQQYWYHYEIWRSGDRIMKKSCYIPKRLLARVEKLEAEKVAVREILVVLGMKG